MSILVTGGLGYIGSHTCVELLNEGYEVVIVDNLSNSHRNVSERIQQVTGKRVRLYEVDLLDYQALESVFIREDIDSVIHFAGLKSIRESIEHPLDYYDNVIGTLNLCKIMEVYRVKKLIFSSTAAIYSNAAVSPITENDKVEPSSPYGETKVLIEQMLMNLCKTDSQWQVIILRYFNPIGAHPSAVLGEMPRKKMDNLIPCVARVAAGQQPYVKVYGADYDTPDGTGIRDYIHVVDLAQGHIKAVKKLSMIESPSILNLGTGTGYSVIQILGIFENISGKKIPYRICPRRQGDTAVSYCFPEKARKQLDWTAHYGIEAMCRDAWNWQLAQE